MERALPTPGPITRDVIVIGGSAGAIEALGDLLHALAADLPAAVFVVVHIGETSVLPVILGRRSALPVEPARSGASFERGHVYVGVPGVHLLLHDNHILLRRGPRENLARPAIDALFRSAAASLGSRVIAVLLSGSLSDGTAGLRAIKRCGGIAVVQDPKEAPAPSMPRNAVRNVDVDHVRPVAGMPALLERLVREPAGPSPEVPAEIRLEAAIAAHELADMKVDEVLGKISPFTCPECHGALWEIRDGPMLRYRCHVGHAFAADAVLAAQNDEIDRMLDTLQRAHQERAAFARRMAEQERAEQRHHLADYLETRAREYEDDAKLVLELMRNGFGSAEPGGDGTGKAGGNGKDEA
ncbi:MAG: chemotaxis protein CheB [Proteobacteria bacterium]|nr:chemotaxis protein CheB [Pseudomonadota bacterium]